jgi:hypothetical protein
LTSQHFQEEKGRRTGGGGRRKPFLGTINKHKRIAYTFGIASHP